MPIYLYEDEGGTEYEVFQKMKDEAFTTLADIKKHRAEDVLPGDEEIKVKRCLFPTLNRWRYRDR